MKAPTPRENVSAVLDEQGRQMAWLARQLGVNRTNLYLMLDGERTMVDDLYGKIARILGVPERLLFAGAQLPASNGESPTDSEDAA